MNTWSNMFLLFLLWFILLNPIGTCHESLNAVRNLILCSWQIVSELLLHSISHLWVQFHLSQELYVLLVLWYRILHWFRLHCFSQFPPLEVTQYIRLQHSPFVLRILVIYECWWLNHIGISHTRLFVFLLNDDYFVCMWQIILVPFSLYLYLLQPRSELCCEYFQLMLSEHSPQYNPILSQHILSLMALFLAARYIQWH